MKIIVEKNVPFVEIPASVGSVIRLPYDEIRRETVSEADALIVRTRNRCDATLLEGTKVKFVGTATIGTDHVDMEWCAAHGIEVANAPGCNAPAVAQYVFSSLMRVISRPLKSYKIGVVGMGHVGSIVERWARSMGMKTLPCDPFLGCEYTTADLAREADIITFHTPLTYDGPHPTFHMAGDSFFNSLRRAPIIINSARGAVVDNGVWTEALSEGVCGAAVVDCWENEPEVDFRLLSSATIATPHIAGYSLDGKKRATQMVLDALCRHFSLPRIVIGGDKPRECAASITPMEAYNTFDPMELTEKLKACPDAFERLRTEYELRPEPAGSVEN